MISEIRTGHRGHALHNKVLELGICRKLQVITATEAHKGCGWQSVEC